MSAVTGESTSTGRWGGIAAGFVLSRKDWSLWSEGVKGHGKILGAVLIFLILAILSMVLLRTREPICQGKSLTAWLQDRDQSFGSPGKPFPREHISQIEEAIRQMGQKQSRACERCSKPGTADYGKRSLRSVRLGLGYQSTYGLQLTDSMCGACLESER